MKLSGVWLPIISPFKNDEIDFESYRRLIDYYIAKGINGIIANGTTGESPTLSDSECEKLAEKTSEFVNGRVPVFFGMGGNYTKKLEQQIKNIQKLDIQGLLVVSPYYNRPDQRGIFSHFKAISEITSLPIVMYNIPYRTGRNMENETILKLAGIENIVGIKDCCGSLSQTLELLAVKPEGFSVMTGEDAFYYTSLAHGADGGILASAHVSTEKFLDIYRLMNENNHKSALYIWNQLTYIISLLFKEPNPAPLKYILHKNGLINSGELRLPLLEISDNLKYQINHYELIYSSNALISLNS